MDMGGMGGGPGPTPAAVAPQPPAAPGTRGGAGTRGFVITLKCTSPDKNAVQLVYNQLLTNLMAIWPDANRQQMEYGVAKAMMVSANQIDQDPARMALLKSQYDSALQAKRIADQASAAAKSAAAQAVAASGPPGGQPGAGRGVFGMPQPQFAQPGGADPNAAAVPDPNDAFKDRLTGEDMRKDWEFTVLFAVQLDPPPAAPAAATRPRPHRPVRRLQQIEWPLVCAWWRDGRMFTPQFWKGDLCAWSWPSLRRTSSA
jgi:hypothetical protein